MYMYSAIHRDNKMSVWTLLQTLLYVLKYRLNDLILVSKWTLFVLVCLCSCLLIRDLLSRLRGISFLYPCSCVSGLWVNRSPCSCILVNCLTVWLSAQHWPTLLQVYNWLHCLYNGNILCLPHKCICCAVYSNYLISFWKDPRPVCKYGASCYQKNLEHRKAFYHPGGNEVMSNEPGKSSKVCFISFQYHQFSE